MGHGRAGGGAISDGDIEGECASCENGTCEGGLVNPGSERHGFPKIPAESQTRVPVHHGRLGSGIALMDAKGFIGKCGSAVPC